MKYDLEHYRQYLTECEKSKNTIEKYLRDVRAFLIFSGERELSKEIILDYKKLLIEKYRTSSVNSMLIAVNGYLSWIGRDDLRVRVCRTQRRIFREEERELTREEYQRLLMTARRENRERLFCIITSPICAPRRFYVITGQSIFECLSFCLCRTVRNIPSPNCGTLFTGYISRSSRSRSSHRPAFRYTSYSPGSYHGSQRCSSR